MGRKSLVNPAAVVKAQPVDDMTLRCDTMAGETVLTIDGPLDAHRCRLLREALDSAARSGRPIVVDLSGVSRLGIVAQACLARAAEDARRSGRTMTLRGLPTTSGPTLSAYRPRRLHAERKSVLAI